jgi:hypothetical protein
MIKKQRKEDQNTFLPEIIYSKPIVALALSNKKFKVLRERWRYKIRTKPLQR